MLAAFIEKVTSVFTKFDAGCQIAAGKAVLWKLKSSQSSRYQYQNETC